MEKNKTAKEREAEIRREVFADLPGQIDAAAKEIATAAPELAELAKGLADLKEKPYFLKYANICIEDYSALYALAELANDVCTLGNYRVAHAAE